jgi:uncharacterized membrane protein
MKQYVAAGLTVLAGAALFEAALVPGLVIGGAAVLAPKYFPKLRRRPSPRANPTVHRQSRPAFSRPSQPGAATPSANPARLEIRRAVAKTITFRIIVTALDFTSNYVVIGEAGTAAGLSTFALVVGPLFYLVHETAWNYFGPSEGPIEVSALLPLRSDRKSSMAGRSGFTISRALAKTITFRTIATAMDFTTIYVVVGDLATAAGLSAFGFVVGPFVYLGHEMVWDRFSGSKGASHSASDVAPAAGTRNLPASAKLLPSPN